MSAMSSAAYDVIGPSAVGPVKRLELRSGPRTSAAHDPFLATREVSLTNVPQLSKATARYRPYMRLASLSFHLAPCTLSRQPSLDLSGG